MRLTDSDNRFVEYNLRQNGVSGAVISTQVSVRPPGSRNRGDFNYRGGSGDGVREAEQRGHDAPGGVRGLSDTG